MNIIIIGIGNIGFHLAKILSQEGHNVSIIDYNVEKINQVESFLDVHVLEGHGASAITLAQAECDKADLLLAVSNNDELNIMSCYVARRLGTRRTIGRIKNRDLLRVKRTFYRKNLGINLILSPENLTSIEILRVIRGQGAVAVENFADGKVQMRRFKVQENATWSDKLLKDIKVPKGVLVAAILREDDIIIPGGNDIISTGDHVLLIGKFEEMGALGKLMGIQEAEARKVMIMGGATIGYGVAKALEPLKMEVKLIEEDKDRCKEISKLLPKTLVLNGDGTDISLLKEEGVSSLDVFVAASGDDEKNIMSGILAKDLGAKKAICVYNKANYAEIGVSLGLDSVISPRLITTNKVLKYIRRGNLHSIATIVEGKAEVVEMEALKDSTVIGKPLQNAGFPEGSIVGAIVRGDDVFVPRGHDEMLENDIAVIFTLVSVLPKVEKLFY